MTQPRIRHDWHLSEELTRQAGRNPDGRFIQMVNGPVCSFGEFDQQVSRLSGGLAALGVEAHDRVAIMGGNSIEFLETLVAITCIGAVAVPINLAYKGGFLEHILNNSGAKILFIDPEFAPVVADSAENLPGITTAILMPGGDKAVTDAGLPGSETLHYPELIAGPQATSGSTPVMPERKMPMVTSTSWTACATACEDAAKIFPPSRRRRLLPNTPISRKQRLSV